MEQSKQQQIRELTDRLNRCRYEYYNLNAPSLTDAEYDALFDELSTLEKETGFSMTNSPTQTVGCYPAVSALVKTVHLIPLLSLDKTKSSAELLRFARGNKKRSLFRGSFFSGISHYIQRNY